MKKALIIYNPMSGNRSVPKNLDYIIRSFGEKKILAIPYRTCGEAEKEVEEVIKSDNYCFIVVSGGDGSVNLVVNTMMRNNINLPLGIIPAGTCNDFARSLNIPSNLKKCLDIILNGNIIDVDTGLINNDHYFLSTLAGGNLVDVSYSTPSEFKKKFGPLAYYMKGLGEISNIKPRHIKITTDNEVIEQDFLLFLILNGKQAAGFNNLVQKADISDGYMDILLVNNCPPIEIAGLFLKVIANDFISDKNVMWLRTKNCVIEGDDSISLTVDGEKWTSFPISVTFINKTLKVFIK